MLSQPGRFMRPFFVAQPSMPQPWKLIEFVEHYPGGFQIGTQRGVPPDVAEKLVGEGVARILRTLGEEPTPAPVTAPSPTPEHHRGKPPRHERTR
jgi:hypothetical protein